jgi:hypothetical protein
MTLCEVFFRCAGQAGQVTKQDQGARLEGDQYTTAKVEVGNAQAAGLDTAKSFAFRPFTPTLPFKLGNFVFVSFTGC